MAQLAPLTIVAPGALGLNKEQEFTLLGPEWATRALNLVFDRSGRLAARRGWVKQSTTSSAPAALVRLHEYVEQDGTTSIVSTTATKVLLGTTDLSNATSDITPISAPTSGQWRLLNFNGKCVGFQAGHQPIVYAGTGTFTDISESSGAAPTGGAACAAFGRLWAVDSDLQTIKYCTLLDETDWGGSDAGSIDMAKVWTAGTDQVVAIEAFGANLVVFGQRHIVTWTSEGGSELGIVPTEMYVADTVEGTGCIARDSVQIIGEGDILFLSRLGVQSLTRVITQKNNPLATLTKNIRSYIQGFIAAETDKLAITSAYSPEQGFYLVNFPAASRTIVVDTRRTMPDEQGDLIAPVTEWLHTPSLADAMSTLDGQLLLAISTDIGAYRGNSDNDDSYDVRFESAWLRLAPEIENRLKIMKEIRTLALVSGNPLVRWLWNFDFGLNAAKSKQVAYSAGSGSEYGIAEYNIAEYAGGLEVFHHSIDASGEGQYVKVGISTSILNAQFVIQQITLFFKLGRMI